MKGVERRSLCVQIYLRRDGEMGGGLSTRDKGLEKDQAAGCSREKDKLEMLSTKGRE